MLGSYGFKHRIINREIVLMRKIYVPSSATLLLLQMFFLLSCKSESKPDIIEESFPEAQAEIREAIRSIVSDAETANIEGLKVAHLVSDKFTKFGPRNFNRQDVISTNNSEEAFFGTITNYKQEILDLKIDVFGDIGIATYYPHVSFVQDGVEKSVSGRQTLVFLKTENGWKIVHEHGTPKQLNMNYAITPNDRASDEAAIRAIESAYDSAWNAGDITSILQLCTEDVVVIDPSGGTSVGRDGMERSLASLFSGVGKGSTHTSEIMGVHFVTDDVALVDGEAFIEGFKTADGGTAPLRHRFTDVVVNGKHGWLIAQVRAYVFMPRPKS
jgi:uncharacterized protein (TIGR02246 family)